MPLIVAPLVHATKLVERYRPTHLITILAPTDDIPRWPEIPSHRHLVLQFHDIVARSPDLVAPDAAAIERLLHFAEDWVATDPLLVHCLAGISRSTAAAFIIACARTEPGREEDIARRLRAAAPLRLEIP